MNPFRRYAGNAPRDRRRDLLDLNYEPHREGAAEQLLEILSIYGDRVVFGNRHPAPCGAWRSERLCEGPEASPRFANRVHLFINHDAPENDSPVDQSVARYLGYVSLRPPGLWDLDPPVAPGPAGTSGAPEAVETEAVKTEKPEFLAVANLAPPLHMLRSRYHVIQCMGGPADGVLPFRCVPYCHPRSNNLQLSCVHGALHAALLLKQYGFGCIPINSQDMIAILWAASQKPYDDFMPEISRRGVSLPQALRVLRDDEVRAGGVLEAFTRQNVPGGTEQAVKNEALRCLADYLSSGLPVILGVRRHAYPNENKAPGSEYEAGSIVDHAVLAVGMHLLRDPEEPKKLMEPKRKWLEEWELPGRLVLHDNQHGPFWEETSEELLARALTTYLPDGTPAPEAEQGIYLLAVGPRGMTLGIRSARQLTSRRLAGRWYVKEYDEFARRYGIRSPGMPGQSATRLVTRLLTQDQVIQRYCSVRHTPNGKLELAPEAEMELKRSLGDGEHGSRLWWAVEARIRESAAAKRRSRKAPRPPRPFPPALVCLWLISDGGDPDNLEAQDNDALPEGDARLVVEFVRGPELPESGVCRARMTARGHEGVEYDWTFSLA